MISTRRRPISAVYIDDPLSCSSVEVAPPKKLNVSTRSRSSLKNITNTSASTSRLVKVAPPKKKQVSTISTTPPSESVKCLPDLIQNAAISGGTFTTPDSSRKDVPSISGGTSTSDWLPDGWTVSVWFTSTGHTYTVFKETATRKKFYSKPEVLNYLGIADSSNSNNRKVKVAPPQKKQASTITTTPSEIPKRPCDLIQNAAISGGTFTTPDSSWKDVPSISGGTFTSDWLPDGWTVVVLAKETGQKYKVYKETATGKKFYSKPQVLNYLGIADSSNSNNRKVKVAPPQKKQVSTITTTPSEIPKKLYDLIQNAAKARKSLKLNSNNRFAKRKLEYYEPRIPRVARYYRCTDELPADWKYDPETSFMAHVPKPPPPPKPKTKKKKKKKIEITWSSSNYHGSYPLNNHEQKVWNEFTMNDTTKANSCECFPIKNLNTVEKDDKVVGLLGKFAVDTFNKSCHMYVNKDEDNTVSGAEFMECKFYKLTKKYIFYMTIEAIEQGIPGVYETRVECKTKNGARTLMNFKLTDRKPKWNRPWVKPREPEVEYETVQDGSSDPQDFYKLTGMVHRWTETAGFNYHNPASSPHILIYDSSKDKNASAFEPNVSQLL